MEAQDKIIYGWHSAGILLHWQQRDTAEIVNMLKHEFYCVTSWYNDFRVLINQVKETVAWFSLKNYNEYIVTPTVVIYENDVARNL